MLRVTASHGTLEKKREGGRDERRRRAIFIHAGALLHKTIRNNRGGITTARSASGMDRADRIDSSAGTLLRLDLAALHFPPFGPVDAPGRRGGTVYFPSFLFFSGPRRRYPTIVFLLPRAGEASQGFRIEFRTPRRTLPTPDLFTVRPAASPRETGLGRNNIDPLKFARRVYKARVDQKRWARSENSWKQKISNFYFIPRKRRNIFCKTE